MESIDQKFENRTTPLNEGFADLERRIKDRLLSAPAFSEDEVRDRGQDPWQQHLIRLPREDETVQLPQFQFGEDGQPRAVVLTVNELLLAEDDPWGVADWWLRRNAWIADAVPAELLGGPSEYALEDLARAVRED
jgi:hypothetical protein